MTKPHPVKRGLDPVFLRVKRDGEYTDRCFTDLTLEEQQKFMDTLEKEGLKRLVLALANALRDLGDQLNVAWYD